MKKMIMLAAIAMGIAAHAATVTWSASNIAPSEANTDVTSYMAYIIDNSVYAQSDVTKDTLAAAVGAAAYSAAIVATSSTATTGKLANQKFTDSYASGDKPSYYMVVIDGSSAADATGFMITAPKTATVTAAGGLTMGFGSMASAAAGGWQEGPGAGTPEPTSGLLLLLGGAMLALRRKQK